MNRIADTTCSPCSEQDECEQIDDGRSLLSLSEHLEPQCALLPVLDANLLEIYLGAIDDCDCQICGLRIRMTSEHRHVSCKVANH